MRITGFHVDGFGLLHDQRVTGIGPGTTVVLGPNEAGKSTLHAFLVRTLFGHPRANDADGRHRHEPLRGGRHGGLVTCEDGRGAWEVHRFTTGSPRLRVVAPDGSEATGTDAALPLLGRTVDAARFEQVFAIDLDDLAGIGSLGGGSLDDLLFDAATVGTGRSLRAARDEALERRDALWTPSSTKRPLAAALEARAAARDALAAARTAARANLDLRRRLDEAAARVDAMGEEQADHAARIALLERVRDAWPAWSRAAALRDRLAALPDEPVDAAALEAARSAAAELVAAEETAGALEDELDEVERTMATLQLDPDAVAVADEVEALAEGLGAHELATEQLAGAVSSSEAAERRVATALAELGDGWDHERVATVRTDAPSRERLVAAGERCRDAAAAVTAATTAAEEAARVAARRADAVEEAVAARPTAPDEGDVVAAEEAVGVLRVGVPALDRTGSPAPAVVRAGPPLAATVLLVAALVLLVPTLVGLLPPGAPASLVAVAGAVLAGVGAYLLGAGRPRPSASAGAATSDPSLVTEVADAARRVGLTERPTLAEVERVATRVEQARRQLRAHADAARHVDRLRNEADEARRVAEDRQHALAATRDEHEAATAAWRAACDAVGLEVDDVRVTLTLHDRVATAQQASTAAREARAEVDRVRPRVTRFRDDATALAGKLGHDAVGPAAVRLLPGLRTRVRAARATQIEHDALASRRARLEDDLAAARASLEERAAARDDALTAVGAADLDALERRARVADERASLEAELAAADTSVAQLLGDGPRGAEGRILLADADPTAWEEELAAAREALTASTGERDAALAERTELAAALRRLGGDDAVPRAAQELAAAEAEVAELAERWAVADTAARLLEATVERFEREQQPRVLTRASELLERATGGQWVQVRRLDEQVVVARSIGGDPVPAAVLSRGTREQLWLCLRLALAEDLSQDRPLPLLVDDLLGTSDPERSLHVARVLAEVARRQQVWLFTCHPRTAELVTSVDPGAGVLRLRRGGRVVGLRRRDDAEGDSVPTLQFDV